MKISAQRMEQLIAVIRACATESWPAVMPGARTYFCRSPQSPQWYATIDRGEMVRISRRGEIRQYWTTL